MGNVIAGFLVRLGFTFDKDQLKKFQGTVDDVNKGMISLTKRGVAAGVAITAAIAKANSEVNKLYTLSNNTGASVHSIRVLGSAFAAVGGSAEDLQSTISNLAQNIKYSNFEPYFNSLGISLRDANGEARDTSDVLLDIRDVLQSMPQEQARPLAETLGISASAYEAMMKSDFVDELNRSKELFGEMNAIIGESSDSSHRLTNEFSRFFDVMKTGGLAIGASLADLLNLDDVLADINNSFAKSTTEFIKWQRGIIESSDGLLDWIDKSLDPVTDWYKDLMSTEIGLDEIKSGARSFANFIIPDVQKPKKTVTTIEESSETNRNVLNVNNQNERNETNRNVLNVNNENERNETNRNVSNINNIDERNEQNRSVVNVSNLNERNETNRNVETIEQAQEVIDRRLLRTRGMRNNNPGNLREGIGQIGTDSEGYAVFPTPQAGYNAAARQLVGYGNAGLNTINAIIEKWAPTSENNTQAYINSVVQSMNQKGFDVDAFSQLDLKNGEMLKALLDSMINHEVGSGAAESFFDGRVYDLITQKQSQNDWQSRVVTPEDRSKNYSISQNITIFANNPEEVRRVLDPMNTARYVTNNLT